MSKIARLLSPSVHQLLFFFFFSPSLLFFFLFLLRLFPESVDQIIFSYFSTATHFYPPTHRPSRVLLSPPTSHSPWYYLSPLYMYTDTTTNPQRYLATIRTCSPCAIVCSSMSSILRVLACLLWLLTRDDVAIYKPPIISTTLETNHTIPSPPLLQRHTS